MQRRLSCLLVTPLLVVAASSPTPAQVTAGSRSVKNQAFEVDALARYEWTTERFGDLPDDRRSLFRVVPHLSLGRDRLVFGVAGDFHYTPGEEQEQTGSLNPATPDTSTLVDNFARRDARVDLAYVRLKPFRMLSLEGGRFKMPVTLTEMVWDADLRPQGAAATLDLGSAAGFSSLSATGLWARGSHVFQDEKTELWLASANASLWTGRETQLQATGSYLQFRHLDLADALTPRLYRQNSLTAAGALANEYRIADVVLRHVNNGAMPLVLYADYCWNTAVDSDNRGLWAGLVLGSTVKTRTRWEYTYARVDRDATLGAYAQDDFLWATAWEGHRAEVTYSVGRGTTFHVIGSMQRPRGVLDADEALHWTRRLRVEWRFHSLP